MIVPSCQLLTKIYKKNIVYSERTNTFVPTVVFKYDNGFYEEEPIPVLVFLVKKYFSEAHAITITSETHKGEPPHG